VSSERLHCFKSLFRLLDTHAYLLHRLENFGKSKVPESAEKQLNVLKETRNFDCQNYGISMLITTTC